MTDTTGADFSVVDADHWQDTGEKIADIQKIFEEEGVAGDPELMEAFQEAVKESLQEKET